ncbi:hypothetical protein PSHT_08258 [Puccinia striiformis]|uniref:Uncharacterized protein n=1 Tax=Puccinia striiformis TaxID=27350 RepID=A0A2S4VRH7_9BASI|nr:hypothetical protein PSHT_08258 [Puccinia striiformis]
MFDENLLEYGQVQELINLWTSTGLPKLPGLACKCQSTATNTVPKSQPKAIPKTGRKALAKRQESVTVVPLAEFVPQVTEYVRENTRLAFKDDLAPQHLYFFNEVASLTDPTIRDRYMASLNWPSTLLVHGYSYTLFSRGFWTNNHYWCKVVRSGEGGATGVWLHDEARNEGIARLVNKDTSSIGGCQPGTSNLINTTPVVVEEASSMEPLPAPVSELIPRPSKRRSVRASNSENDPDSEPEDVKETQVFSDDDYVDNFEDLDYGDMDDGDHPQETLSVTAKPITLKLKVKALKGPDAKAQVPNVLKATRRSKRLSEV